MVRPLFAWLALVSLFAATSCSAPCPPGGCQVDGGSAGGGATGGGTTGGGTTGGGMTGGGMTGGGMTGGGMTGGGMTGGGMTGGGMTGGGGQCGVRFLPQLIDFGVVQVGCAASRTLTLFNDCPTSASVSLAALEGGSPSSAFSLAGVATIPPLGLADIEVRFSPAMLGPVQAQAAGPAGALMLSIPLRGVGAAGGLASDRFDIPAQKKLDVLIVMSDGPGMGAVQQSFAANAPALVEGAISTGFDLRIGVMVGRADGGAAAVVTTSTPDAGQRLANLLAPGTAGAPTERCLSRVLAELGGAPWVRLDASSRVLCVQDSLEQPDPFANAWLRTQRFSANEPTMVNAMANEPPCVGPSDAVLATAADLTFGATSSVCDPTGPSSEVARHLFGAREAFPLSRTLAPDGGVAVTIDGLNLDAGWTIDVRRNAVIFDPRFVPEAGRTLVLTYPAACNP